MTKEELLTELGRKIEEYGMTEVSKRSGVSRTNIYQMLKGNPTLDSFVRLSVAVGFRIVLTKNPDGA